jgi:hypothetical protein
MADMKSSGRAAPEGRSSPQRWLFGMTRVAPLSMVKGSMAHMVETLRAGRGRGIGKKTSSV